MDIDWKAEGIWSSALEFVVCDFFGLSAALDVSAAARQMFRGEHGKSFLQEAAIEIGVVG